MFPALMVRPEFSMISYVAVSVTIAFGMFLNQFWRALGLLSLLLLMALPQPCFSFMATPGGCGTTCMLRGGYFPPMAPYYHPYFYNPYAFYAQPMNFFTMLPPYMVSPYGMLYPRGVQSVEPNAGDAKSLDQ